MIEAEGEVGFLYRIQQFCEFQTGSRFKKVNRKVQGMPQSQTAANPRHQEEEKKDKNIHAQNKQMFEKHKDQLPLPQAR